MLTVLVTILVLGSIIFIHELGHFLAARRAGVQVDEFALGFGPRLAAYRSGGTLYAIRALPIGGFVRMAGFTPDQSEEAGEGAFLKKPVGRRIQIIAAGPAMNFVLSVALFSLIFAVFGAAFPVTDQAVIGEVLEGYPAAGAGLRAGDRVVAVEGGPVRSWTDLVERIRDRPDAPTEVTVERDGRTLTLTVVPTVSSRDGESGFIGIAPQVEHRRLGILESIYRGIVGTIEITVLWFQSVVLMILNRIQADVAGPIGIGQMIGQASRLGLPNLLYLAAALSANFGLLNLIPIPALDGSRLAFLLVERVRGRPIDPEKENLLHFVGFALLMLLAVLVTYRDILRLNA